MARHMAAYFSFENIEFWQWTRREGCLQNPPQNNREKSQQLLDLCQRVDRVLLLISDDAIAETYNFLCAKSSAHFLHFSGNLQVPGCHGLHPLNTFGLETYDRKTYRRTPFILDENTPDFPQLLPELTNPWFRISADKRALYHGLCSMAGNFTQMLWSKLFTDFENQLNLPPQIAHPYMEQVFHNLVHQGAQSLTGPIARGDQKTIDQHLKALSNDAYSSVYRSFLQTLQHTKESQ